MRGLFFLLLLTACTHQPVVQSTKRDLAEIEARLSSLRNAERISIGSVSHQGKEYSLPSVIFPPRTFKNDKRLNVLLTGSVHGDEPVGTYALLEFLEKRASNYTKDFRFFVLPLVNPVGFEANTAENGKKENINRQFFKNTNCPEAKLIMQALRKWKVRFAFFIDMHEIPPYWEDEGFKASDNPREAYLYETQPNLKKRFGRKMIDGLPPSTEVCQWPTIYGDKADRGLVSYPEANGNAVYALGTTLDAYVIQKHSSHTFTAETPIGWPLEKRIATQLSWLETALLQVKAK